MSEKYWRSFQNNVCTCKRTTRTQLGVMSRRVIKSVANLRIRRWLNHILWHFAHYVYQGPEKGSCFFCEATVDCNLKLSAIISCTGGRSYVTHWSLTNNQGNIQLIIRENMPTVLSNIHVFELCMRYFTNRSPDFTSISPRMMLAMD